MDEIATGRARRSGKPARPRPGPRGADRFRRAMRPLWGLALLAFLAPGAACSTDSPRSDAVSAAAQVPARGQILRRTLRTDPSQEYLMYLPAHSGPGTAIFVTVHGISRNVEEHAELFAPWAEEHGVVLVAPRFTEQRNPGYQRLDAEGPGLRADLALNAILKDVAATTGADDRRFYLFGYSGGAQFAHRYALAHPERVIRAVIGAAGWYTFPDEHTPYPYGLGPSAERPAVPFDPDRFLRVPFTVIVGGEDTEGGESLRRNEFVDHQQGTTRRERGRKWVAAMNDAARKRGLPPPASYEEAAGVRHSFRQFMQEGDLGDRVFGVMFGSAQAAEGVR